MKLHDYELSLCIIILGVVILIAYFVGVQDGRLQALEVTIWSHPGTKIYRNAPTGFRGNILDLKDTI